MCKTQKKNHQIYSAGKQPQIFEKIINKLTKYLKTLIESVGEGPQTSQCTTSSGKAVTVSEVVKDSLQRLAY